MTGEDLTFSSYNPGRLRFFLRGQPQLVYPLYELLLERTLRLAGKAPPTPVTTGVPSPVGFDEGRSS